MQLDELITSRRTVHNFTTERVDDACIHRAVELSLWAPNHKQTYPWAYTLVTPEARASLADLAVRLKSARGGELSEIKARAIKSSITGPSHVLSLGVKLSGDQVREKEDYATLACSVQILSLYLWQQNVATKWSTGGWSMHADTYAILGLDPRAVRLEGALIIGRAQMVPTAPARPPLSAVLR